MAIISAGVIMNVIFAFVMAVVAVSPWMGVPTPPCVVGGVLPGEPAWQADLRPSDEILKIGDKEMTQFGDLQRTIPLGDFDPKVGVPLLVRRPPNGETKGETKTITVRRTTPLGRSHRGQQRQHDPPEAGPQDVAHRERVRRPARLGGRPGQPRVPQRRQRGADQRSPHQQLRPDRGRIGKTADKPITAPSTAR